MSVCNHIEGTAELSETLFEEDAEWGAAWYFPVLWKERHGVTRVQMMDKRAPEEGNGIDLRFTLSGNDDVVEALDEFLSDLRVDDFRPWRFTMRRWNEDEQEAREVDVAFAEMEGDKYDHQDAIQEQLLPPMPIRRWSRLLLSG